MRIAADHRDAILQAAAKLFARKPFHEVLMDDVAEKTGIAKGSLYRYYPNKDELFGALAMRHIEMLGTEMGVVAASEAGPLERLRCMLMRMGELVEEHRDFFQVLMRHECELWAQRSSEFQTRRNVIRDHFADVIRSAEEAGELYCPFDDTIAADMLLGMMRSLIRFAIPTPGPEQAAEMAMHLFVHGLKTNDKRSVAKHAQRKPEPLNTETRRHRDTEIKML